MAEYLLIESRDPFESTSRNASPAHVLRLVRRIHECDGEDLLGHVNLLVPESLVPSFQMVDHNLDWRDLDTVAELGDAPLFEREVIGEYLDAGAD